MSNLTNAQLAEARARIIDKLNVDRDVEKAFANKSKISFSQKAKLVNDHIESLKNTELEDLIKNGSQKQKRQVYDLIAAELRAEKKAEELHKQKLAVDIEVEKSRNAPNNIRNVKSYSQKATEVDELKKFYQRQNKEKNNIDRTLEKAFGLDNDIFTKVKLAKPEPNIYSYRKLLKHIPINDTRHYVENNRRIKYKDPVPGSYFSFRYWAKWYQTLPKFDRSPLIYVLGDFGDRFLGINFHYCKSVSIAFDLIEQIENEENYINFPDECYHTYLKEPKYLQSPLYHIGADEIRTAILLPLTQWYIR